MNVIELLRLLFLLTKQIRRVHIVDIIKDIYGISSFSRFLNCFIFDVEEDNEK